MALTRRNTIVGLGALAAGAGVIGGTGAFTAVEAERQVSVEAAGDQGALLAFEVGEAPFSDTGEDNIIELGVDDLNLQAVTRFDRGLTVTNNGENTVGLYVDADESGDEIGEGGVISDITVDGDSILGDEDDAVVLAPGEANSVEIGFEFTLLNYSSTGELPTEGYDLWFVADVDAEPAE